MSGNDAAVGAPERLHIGFLLNGLTRSLRSLGGAWALIVYLFVSGRAMTAIGGIIALLIFIAIATFIYWRRFEFRVGEDEIRIDSGVLSRTHRSIPFDRIQDVDITQGPLARIFGLAKVTFETGGGSAAAGKEEGVLQAITLERAQELRQLVRARRSGVAVTAATAGAEDEVEAEPVYAMGPKRLLLAGFFNFSLALFAGLFGATQWFGDALGFDPFSRAFWNSILSAGDPIRTYILAHQAVAAVAGLIVLIFLGIFTGTVRTVVREFGFRLDKTGVGLRRRRGLFTKTDVTLPARRLQAAIIGTGPIRERFSFGELRFQSLARDEDKAGSHVLAPLATPGEADHILSELNWKPLPDAIPWEPVSRTYFWKFTIIVVPLLAAALATALALSKTLALAWLVAPFVVLLGRHLEWKRIGFSLDGDRLLVRTGWFRRRTTILPLGKIQSIDLKHSVISRVLETASMQFGVAGGNALVAHSIPDIPIARARQLRDQLLGLSS